VPRTNLPYPPEFRAEAIRLYTRNGAYASFDDNVKGSIEMGKLADLVVLDDRILDVPEHKIKGMGVTMTMVDGEVIFQKVAAEYPA
jgi:predicted amidohydrolase YtcJ